MRLTHRQTLVVLLVLFLCGCGHTIPGSLTGDVAPNLSDAGVAGFLTIVDEQVSGDAGPVSKVCGVRTEHWTMPSAASTLLFEPRP